MGRVSVLIGQEAFAFTEETSFEVFDIDNSVFSRLNHQYLLEQQLEKGVLHLVEVSFLDYQVKGMGVCQQLKSGTHERIELIANCPGYSFLFLLELLWVFLHGPISYMLYPKSTFSCSGSASNNNPLIFIA